MKVYDVPTLVDKMLEKKYLLDMGKGSISKRFNVTKEEVIAAKRIAKNIIMFGTEYHPNDVSFRKVLNKFPKILIFDIETSPSMTYTWGRFKQNIGLHQVIQDPIMLTWSAKWLYSTEIISDAITPEEVREFDDFRITASLWRLLDEADVVVAHFGDRFDIPMLNSRAIVHGLVPYTSVKSIDTKQVASSQFKFPSNKLDALATYFNLAGKLGTDFSLWKNCLAGDKEAIDKMREYNNQDVILLEEVYLRLRPWIRSHPNAGIYMENDNTVCACCGSDNVYIIPNKFYHTQTTKYPVYRCKNCGGLTRGRRTVLKKEVSKVLGTSIPR